MASIAFLLIAGVGGSPASGQQTAMTSRGDLVLKDDAKCTRCHDEEDNPKLMTIGRTKHGTRADGRTPTCVTCHGESELHINNPGGGKVRPKPDRTFDRHSETPASVRSDVCLGCHAGGEQIFWSSGTHAARDITCSNCHQIHNGGHDKVRERRTQALVCTECHKKQRIQIHKPSRHPILEGKVVCSDCHNPHGTAGPTNLRRVTVNDTCFQCHAEKRGPFLWPHQPVTENCGYCHDPHGTTTASLLKWRVPFLCQQCHEGTSAGTHQGDIPLFGPRTGSITGQNILMARGCVNCHTNIHGGNNPTASSASRSMRQ